MKILKEGMLKQWPKKGRCGFCGCYVEVEKDDVQDMRDRPTEPLIWGIKCPTTGCHGYIYFKP